MKKFMILTYGFVPPTQEIMAAWGQWFGSIAEKIADHGGHFSAGREISDAGTRELPLGIDSITGFLIINAENLDEAEKIAQACPHITSTRVYEMMTK